MLLQSELLSEKLANRVLVLPDKHTVKGRLARVSLLLLRSDALVGSFVAQMLRPRLPLGALGRSGAFLVYGPWQRTSTRCIKSAFSNVSVGTAGVDGGRLQGSCCIPSPTHVSLPAAPKAHLKPDHRHQTARRSTELFEQKTG